MRFLLMLALMPLLLLACAPAFAAKPKSSLAYQYYSKGVELTSHKKWEEALKQFQSGIDLNPAFVTCYIEYARTAVMSGNRKAGLEKLGNALGVARSKEDRERIQKERESLSDIFYTNETFQQYQNGLNYLRLDRSGSAVESLERAMKTEPDNLLVLLAYARALRQEERPKDAFAALERALALNDTRRDIRLELAEATLGPAPARALDLLQPLRDTADERSSILEAQALSALKRNREAIELLRLFYDKQPGAVYPPLWLGKLYALEGNGAWNARKYLMTFLKRTESQALTLKDDTGPEARQLKSARVEANQILARVNLSLE